MARVRRLGFSLSFGILLTGLAVGFTACSSDASLSPGAASELNFIALGSEGLVLSKTIQVSNYVTQQSGGTLSLQFKAPKSDSLDVQVKITLVVLPDAISEDAELILSLDDETLRGNVDVTFQPHGITFSKPAILNIQAKGLDLSGIDASKIDIYYDNPESGEWEKMPRKRVIVKEEQGFINVVAAEIPHFSRYAVAWSN